MPTAAARACSVPGCPSLVTRDHPCPTHVRPAWSGAGRGSTRRWRERRMWVLKANPFCAACRAEGRAVPEPAVDVDHRVPLSQGGGDEYENLQPLCRAHHVAKTGRERAEGPPASVFALPGARDTARVAKQ